MCTTCGCGEHAAWSISSGHGTHAHDHSHGRVVKLDVDVLEKSRLLAEDNRAWLAARGILMVNLMSAPGAGKTTLLERTIRDVGASVRLAVIEGDQATSFDAERIRAAGANAVQVNTGAGCHLDPHMVRHGLEDLGLDGGGVVIVENVGNLVCPALFPLGEAARVVLLSVTEGDDKPLKYPHMFACASMVLLTKVDLLPYVPFDTSKLTDAVRAVNATAPIHHVSVLREGGGMDGWYELLRSGSSGQAR